MMQTDQKITEFRLEMVKLSQKYPFIKRVTIDEDAWGAMCKSFDKNFDREEGTTEKHISSCDGSMKFQDLFVENEDVI